MNNTSNCTMTTPMSLNLNLPSQKDPHFSQYNVTIVYHNWSVWLHQCHLVWTYIHKRTHISVNKMYTTTELYLATSMSFSMYLPSQKNPHICLYNVQHNQTVPVWQWLYQSSAETLSYMVLFKSNCSHSISVNTKNFI